MTAPLAAGAARQHRRTADAALAALLVLLVVLAFGGVIGNGFVAVDDPAYITGNEHVRDGLSWRGTAWAITSTRAANWHPLTWLSHQLDATLFGLRPAGHHAVSLGLHAANAALLFLFLARASGARWRSALAAALFAVHPLRVESVAWAAERKDVLSGLLFLLTLAAYLAWVRRPSPWRRAALVAVYALGLAAKPMLVSLPLLLLLLDAWPLGRFRARGTGGRAPDAIALLREKLPLFALAAASAAVTLWAQGLGGAFAPAARYPLSARLANAAIAAARYLDLALWPRELWFHRPHPGTDWSPEALVASALALAAIAGAAAAGARSRPWLAAGWLWYLVALVPVVGIVQVGRQAMADRYTYLPLIGPAVAVVWGAGELVGAARRRRAAAALLTAGVLVALVAATRVQVAVWRDSETLTRAVLRVDTRNQVAHNILGTHLLESGRLPEAEAALREALRLSPDYDTAAYNLGLVLAAGGRYAEAAEFFAQVAARRPDDGESWHNLGEALARQGRAPEAAAALERAARIEPDNFQVHRAYARALLAAGDAGGALAALEALAARHPREPDFQREVGYLLEALGRDAEARGWFEQADALAARGGARP